MHTGNFPEVNPEVFSSVRVSGDGKLAFAASNEDDNFYVNVHLSIEAQLSIMVAALETFGEKVEAKQKEIQALMEKRSKLATQRALLLRAK